MLCPGAPCAPQQCGSRLLTVIVAAPDNESTETRVFSILRCLLDESGFVVAYVSVLGFQLHCEELNNSTEVILPVFKTIHVLVFEEDDLVLMLTPPADVSIPCSLIVKVFRFRSS